MSPVSAYLRRLGLPLAMPPTFDTLRAIHRAHLQRVPYDNVDVALGRAPAPEPAASLDRLVTTGRGGYCFHQNAALGLVLRTLGFAVTDLHGHVWTRPEHRDGPELTHLVIVVDGLPTAANPGGRWWPDAGLGDGFRDPLPVLDGEHADTPFRFTLHDVRADGWSFRHRPDGGFAGVEVRPAPLDVTAAHAALSTPPDGTFTSTFVVCRRDAGGSDTVHDCTWKRDDATGRREVELTTYDAWRGALDALGLALGDVADADVRSLFARCLARHRERVAAGRS